MIRSLDKKFVDQVYVSGSIRTVISKIIDHARLRIVGLFYVFCF